MGSERANVKIETTAESTGESYAVVEHPVSKVPLLLVSPEWQERPPVRRKVTCDDAVSFAKVVSETGGENAFIEFTPGGIFRWVDEIGEGRELTVEYELKPAPTTKLLCLGGFIGFPQKDLLWWNEQWPGTLVPDDEAAWEFVGAYNEKTTQKAEVSYSEQGVRVAVETEKAKDGKSLSLPKFWKAVVPVYAGNDPEEVTLRLEVETPEADGEGGVTGRLLFKFTLWTPDAESVKYEGRQKAMDRMQDLLENYIVINGRIGE